MREPMQMPKAYVRKLSFFVESCWISMALGDFTEAAVSAPFQLVMFSVAGIGGYLYMGNKVG